ncbi:MAG: PCRF domain-containing protein, partial [Treponema sp.]|nr:PCRF domain-containing protein [Treponema sp.]
MNERLDSMLQRHRELAVLILDPDLVRDRDKYRDVMKEYSQLSEIVTANDEIKKLSGQIDDTKSLMSGEKDPEMKELAREELKTLEITLKDHEDRLKFLLIPRDPMDEKNIIMEIRAG